MISNIKRFFFIIFNVIVFSYVCFAELIDDFYSESIDENVVDK